MNFELIFENAVDATSYEIIQFLPELNFSEISEILNDQIVDFNNCSPPPPVSENEEIHDFIAQIRKARISLGFTQTEMAKSITIICGKKISQTTVCRFEGKILPKRNLRRLRPTFENWLAIATSDPAYVKKVSFQI